MGWRSWLGFPEKRAITSVPWQNAVPFNLMPPTDYDSGSQSAALSLSSVYSANRLLAQSISTLPLKAYRRAGEDRVPLGKLPQLFDQLVTDGQLVPWLHKCVVSLGLRGNAYGWVISRDGFGFPTQVDWLHPNRVSPDDQRGRFSSGHVQEHRADREPGAGCGDQSPAGQRDPVQRASRVRA
jgi:hypothetical protein